MDSTTQLQNALAEAKPTLVEFYKEGCPHCAEQAPIIDELKERVGDKANVISIDGTANPALVEKYHVHSAPTYILFKDGQECWRDGGRKPYSELRDMLDRFM
ncbi:MAG: thioredoxin family protein [Muribaculaceae bacterium]|nr:thioredoxin family protein [Muribaculaceae bacterium]